MFVETFQYLVLHKHFSFNIKACALKPESQIFWDKNSIIPESLPASPPLTKNPEDSGEFGILMAARVKFPTPRHLLNVNFPPLG